MKKIAIVCGNLKSDIQKKAVEVLSSFLLDYTLEYPICVKYGEMDLKDFRCIYIGTKNDNEYILKNSKSILKNEEGYYINVNENTVIIEGYDDKGVLYGCIDFYNKYIIKNEHPHTDKYWINIFEKDTLAPFECYSFPSVKTRGLWTWGHVIYDYKNYIDNMVKLKMNSIIIWNDFVPVNAKEIIEYAHKCGIKIIWGYAWMWDTNCKKFDIKLLEDEPLKIFEKYEKEYAHLGGDGIYFQSFTELNTDSIDGVLIADAVTDLVNRTSDLFFEKYPDILLQFGLHATSVKEKLEYIKKVDNRICIVWENCGSFPFSYVPNDVGDFENTLSFVEKIASLRGEDDNFGVVTKGLVKLDWSCFEHLSNAHYLGVSSKQMKENRIIRKRRIWRYIQAYWLTNADKVYDMIKYIDKIKKGDFYSYALVEDGMFEENIMYPVALYSEMLWNTNGNLNEIMENVALRSYVDFA
ncbi:MAG: hypothetical protein E7391_02460 [Ruminococcaceae bacterium]|nr:hypothetical protein [Oscillospiraceae bacterium]